MYIYTYTYHIVYACYVQALVCLMSSCSRQMDVEFVQLLMRDMHAMQERRATTDTSLPLLLHE